MAKLYKFKAVINGETLYPKGFYYQGKHVVLVGCVIQNHTIRRKELLSEVEIIIDEDTDSKR